MIPKSETSGSNMVYKGHFLMYTEKERPPLAKF